MQNASKKALILIYGKVFKELLAIANLAHGVDFVDEVNFLVILLVVIKVCLYFCLVVEIVHFIY